MTHGGFHDPSGTRTDIPAGKIPERTPKQQCELEGGFWDEETQTCLRVPPKPEEPPKVEAPGPEVFTDPETGRTSGVVIDGETFFGVSPEDVRLLQQQKQEQQQFPAVGTAQRQADVGQRLAGQIGQFGQLPVSPTGLDIGEAATTGVIGSIPGALRMAGSIGVGAAVLGGAARGAAVGTIGAAPTGGLSIAAGAAIGAAVGLVAGIVGGMTSNFRSQRTDSTTAQQRVLDEGKQTLMDWVTLARADPANKTYYLAQYNMQSALINQAYRQMKLDTSRDVGKFETALPNLAEFETFYSTGGERDALDLEMRNALLTVSPENYNMLELTNRRGSNE